MSKKVVIVGGVAGGAGTAARLRRLDESAQIVLLERGDYISFANCGLPYYIGDTIKERGNLLVMPAALMKSRFNIDIRVKNEVVEILRAEKKVKVVNHETGEEYLEDYDTLVLSTGSSPLMPNIEGIEGDNIFRLWNMNDTDRLKAYVVEKKPQSAVVVGGGFIGLEMVENLIHLGLDVSLVEMQEHVMPNVDLDIAKVIHSELEKNGVKLYLGKGVTAFGDGEKGKVVTLNTGEQLTCDMVMLCIGVSPNGQLAKNAGLRVNQRGGIIVDDYLKTDDDNIYALGDVIEVKNFVSGKPVMIPLAGPANKQGRICADNINGKKVAYPGSMGTSVAKIFDLAVAATGLTKKALQMNGLELGKDFFEVKTHAWSHATYYPGSSQMAIKLFFDKDGKILGAQAAGKEGVDKRIDVIATVMKLGGNVSDLKSLELCYAPPFSSAKDPVNMLGFMADNKTSGLVDFISCEQLEDLDMDQTIILDVREQAEVDNGHIPGITHIPLGELRARLGELDQNKKIVVVCAIGLRAYIGCRILRLNGFKDVVDLSGGYTTYKTLHQ